MPRDIRSHNMHALRCDITCHVTYVHGLLMTKHILSHRDTTLRTRRQQHHITLTESPARQHHVVHLIRAHALRHAKLFSVQNLRDNLRLCHLRPRQLRPREDFCSDVISSNLSPTITHHTPHSSTPNIHTSVLRSHVASVNDSGAIHRIGSAQLPASFDADCE